MPQALSNIENKQVKQKENQNKNNNVVNLSLKSKVFIRLEKLLNKLEPRYIGPYYVDGYTLVKIIIG